MDIQDKKVTVVGLGLHGGAVGTIEWLHTQGAHITVTDLKSEEQLQSTIKRLQHIPNITYVLGEHRDKDFTEADMIVRNPAVPRHSEYLKRARRAGIPIEMDSSLFFRYSPTQDIIGITGSKGKTSTSYAVSAVLQGAGLPIVTVGVDGISPLGNIGKVHPNSIVVFELSSWRLEALQEHKISPHTAIVTSIYPDHLNTYESMDEYISVKQSIYASQKPEDIVVLNNSDPTITTWNIPTNQNVYWYGVSKGDSREGVFLQGNSIVMRMRDEEEVIGETDIFASWPDHMINNFLAAIVVGKLRSVSNSDITASLSSLQHFPHRLEEVRTKDDVTFINDSAATMPDATSAALSHFGKTSTPVVLIIGGGDKQVPYDALAQKMKEFPPVALVWLPGTATDRMKAVITSAIPDISSYDVQNMSEAVKKAAQIAQPHQIVLLSPGATSFGLFLHEFDRGDQFKKAVMELL